MDENKNVQIPAADLNQMQEQGGIPVDGKDATMVLNTEAFGSIIDDAVNSLSEEERERKARLDSLIECRMSFSAPIPPEEYLLEIDGSGFFAKGDVHGIKAKQKSGKTSAIMVMVAAMLCGKCFRVKCLKEGTRIIWIDTEQKMSDTYANYTKVFELAGIGKRDAYDRLEIYSMRRKTMDEKIEALKDLIAEHRPDVVFIDGIVDLVKNFNEVEDSQEIMTLMLQLSAEYGCAIVCVLHTNKDVTDHNMRGHLGTILSQRSGNVFECQKNEGVITVSCSDSRHGDVPAWSIMYDKDGNLVDADAVHTEALRLRREELEKRRADKKAETEAEHLSFIKETIGTRMSMKELVGKVSDHYENSARTAKRWITDFISQGKLFVDADYVLREPQATVSE